MKPLRSLGIVLMAAVLIAVVWRWRQPSESGSQKPAVIVAEKVPVVVPKPLVPKNVLIAAPTAAAAPASGPLSITPSAEKSHPHADLNRTISDAISILQSGDTAGFYTNIVSPRAIEIMLKYGHFANLEDFIQYEQQKPDMAEQNRQMLMVLLEIQNTTPEYLENGDQAVYWINPSSRTGTNGIIFRKIDDVWYLQ